MAGGVGLGNHFFDDHKNHGPGGKSQSKGKNGFGDTHDQRPENSGYGLDDAGKLPKEEGAIFGKTLPKQRHGYGHALGYVLQSHTEHQGHGPGDAGFGSA